MLCENCKKLSYINTKKSCVRCQNPVFISLAVLCDTCSANNKQCSACLKKLVTAAERNIGRGCGCGGRK